MYTKEQVEAALAMYEQTGSVTETIDRLGYPSKAILYQWIDKQSQPRGERSAFRGVNTPEHPRHPSAEIKLNALYRCFQLGEDVKAVAEEIGYSRASIYAWRNKYVEQGPQALCNSGDHPRGNFLPPEALEPDTGNRDTLESLKSQLGQMTRELEELRRQVERLRQRETRSPATQSERSAAWVEERLLAKAAY